MVSELASSMCKPLISFLKEMKGDIGTYMVVLKLQRLVTEMDSKISLEVQTLASANDEYKAQVKKIDFQLQAQNREVEKMSLEGETMRRSLEEKLEDIAAFKVALAVKAAEKQNYRSRLDGEITRAYRLDEELKQKEAKLADVVKLLKATKLRLANEHSWIEDACTKSKELWAYRLDEELKQKEAKLVDAVKLLQATKLRLAHEHSRIEDACTKSKELCSRLSDVENSLSQTKASVTSYINGDADATKEVGQLAHVQ